VKLYNFLKENFFEDKNNWILWLPIIFIIGILLRFYFNNTVIIYIIIVLFVLISFFRKKEIFLIILFLLFGFFRAYYYINNFENNFLEESTGYVDIEGIVERIVIKKNYLNIKYKELLISVKNIIPTDKSFDNFKENMLSHRRFDVTKCHAVTTDGVIIGIADNLSIRYE
jgi:hypothetical protein